MEILTEAASTPELISNRTARDILKDIFDDTITDILRLINDQVQRVRLKQGFRNLKVDIKNWCTILEY